MRFPGHSAKLVRICEITRNFHRCKIFLIFFANFCKREAWYESNESRVPSRELQVPSATFLRTPGEVPGNLQSLHAQANCPSSHWPALVRFGGDAPACESFDLG